MGMAVFITGLWGWVFEDFADCAGGTRGEGDGLEDWTNAADNEGGVED